MERAKILVVDDERGIRDAFVELFDGTPLDCETAGNAEEALQKVKHGKPDVVLLDIQLPGMDGLEALRQIKKIHPTAVVIIITGHGTVERSKKAMDLGAYEYVMKPFQMKELYRLIAKAVKVRRLEQQVATLREKVSKKPAREEDEP